MTMIKKWKALSKLDKIFIVLYFLTLLGSFDNGIGAILSSSLGLAFWYIVCRLIKKKFLYKKDKNNTENKIETTENNFQAKNNVNNEYIVIHTDTTGLDPEYDEILRITALRVINGKIDGVYSTLVKPVQEIDEGITGINGITNKMVETAPNIDQALLMLKDFIKDTDVLVGYNAVSYTHLTLPTT